MSWIIQHNNPMSMQRILLCKLALASSLGILLSLSACGGGGGSGGQDPDPVVIELPIAYVKRPVPVDVDDDDNDGDVTEVVQEDIEEPDTFHGGAALFIRGRAAPSATERNVTARAWPANALYDVKDVEVSYDGEKLIFAMRAPDDPDLDDDEQAKWDIWEYDLPTDTLRRIITDNTLAQEANDLSPHYLPDGSIVFSSDRQQRSKAILLDDGKPRFAAMHEDNQNGEYAFNLHRMNDNGSNISQITFNQSHDIQPTVLADGRVLFLRWDNYIRDNYSLYTVHPDGSNLQFYYGYHSQDTGTNGIQAIFSQPREMPNGDILINQRPRVDDRYGGDIVLIHGANFTEIDRPTYANSAATGPGQVSASLLEVNISNPQNAPNDPLPIPSPHGHFNSAYPFSDGTDRMLVSWNQCRLINPSDPGSYLPCTDGNLADPDAVEGPPVFGLWIYNPVAGTQLPVVTATEGVIYSDVVTMESRDRPFFIQDLTAENPDWVDDAVGVMHIRSVYDLDGADVSPGNSIANLADPGNAAFATRPARFLKIVKAVSEPDDDVYDFDNEAFGVAGGQRMKEILGYVPIEPDGSAKFLVPSDVAFSISILDESLSRIRPRHQNWLQVRPGETLQCNGCHTASSEMPHGRFDAEAPSINLGAPITGQPFPNTDISLPAEQGETMAETYARLNGPRVPNFNIIYTDEWTDSANAGLTPDADITIKYSDTDPTIGLNTTPPVSIGCQNTWSSLCRDTINYLTHIQPIWDYPGRTNDAVVSAVCVDCHSRTTIDPLDMVTVIDQLPAGQLELTSDPIGPLNRNPNMNTWVVSYLDLFIADYQMELDMAGNLVRTLIPTQTGIDPVDSTPIIEDLPIIVPAPVPSGRFANVFAPGGTHDGGVTRLTPHELKLISEWLDIGAQYYNNPFAAPLN